MSLRPFALALLSLPVAGAWGGCVESTPFVSSGDADASSAGETTVGGTPGWAAPACRHL